LILNPEPRPSRLELDRGQKCRNEGYSPVAFKLPIENFVCLLRGLLLRNCIFPKQAVGKEKWFQILGVQPIVTKFVYVCSRHFTEDCFYTTPKEIRYLKKTAVPI
jgi:hypothetical protein